MKEKEIRKRNDMRFFRNWWESLEAFPDNETKAVLYNAIFRYSFDGITPNTDKFSGMAKMYWSFIFPLLQASRKTWIDRSQSPGAPKGNKNAKKKPQLGNGEWIDKEGARRYGSGKYTVPLDAPPRPGEGCYWSEESKSWVSGV